MKAKLTEQNTIQFPTPEDYTDSVLTSPSDWKEYVESPRPTDTAMHRYTERFDLVSDSFGGEYKIVQCWVQNIIEPIGRAARLSGTELIFPNRDETLPDGTLICGFNMLPNSQKMAYGWYLVKETEYPADGKTYRETGVLEDDADYGQVIKIVWVEVVPVPEPPFSISKILLKKEMRVLGYWDQFMTVLKSDPDKYEDFDMAVVLMSDDPRVLEMKQICVQMFGFTLEQVDGMLESCKSDL